jgi:hypothetical protein
MGRTLPSASIVLRYFQEGFNDFARALSPSDRKVLEDLFAEAANHVAELAYAASPLPGEMAITAMLLEEHKTVIAIDDELEKQQAQLAAIGASLASR